MGKVNSMFVDSHCHLDWFNEPKEVAKEATAAGVGAIITCSTNKESLEKHISMAGKINGVHVCLGIHPCDLLLMPTTTFNAAFSLIEKNIGKAVAVGEVGIDYKRADNEEKRKRQEEMLVKFIELSKENSLPIVVHARFAEMPAMKLLEKHRAEKVLMHWFTNSVESVKLAADLGYYFSAGPITIHSKEAAEVASKMPLENLLLETDSPVPFKGKQSTPAWIPKVCERIAELHNVESTEMAKITTKNANRLFGVHAGKA
jgi:TatD DNase family protein